MILSSENTLLQDIQIAKDAGYTTHFRYSGNVLIDRTTKKSYTRDQCLLTEYCRYEGLSDPSDAAILFLIECTDGNKGCITSAYGIYADVDLMGFMLLIKRK